MHLVRRETCYRPVFLQPQHAVRGDNAFEGAMFVKHKALFRSLIVVAVVRGGTAVAVVVGGSTAVAVVCS